MAFYLIIISVVIFACVFMNRVTNKLGIPTLLAFIGLGMLFGVGGPFKIGFSNYRLAEQICTVALIFIMFYGGFGTNWKQAKKVAKQSILMSTVGVLMTACIVAVFVHFVLQFSWIESFLTGSVISSTDAASVFSMLRSRNLNLKYNTASILELESGSNDPVAYMMTAIFLAVYQGGISGGEIFYMVFAQIVYGLAIGFGIAIVSRMVLKKARSLGDGFNMIAIAGIAVAAYAIPSAVGGNGYLSTYIVGMVLGNTRIHDKSEIVHFFDGFTAAAQMLVFFLLGLLSEPSMFPTVFVPGIIIALFMTFIARPATAFALLAPFKAKVRQILLVSWSGLRGASSIVFAISVLLGATTQNNIFYIAFFIVLVSISLQGTLLPMVADKLGMIDEDENVMKTFTDYSEEMPVQFIQFEIPEGHVWEGKSLKDIVLPPETIVVLLMRGAERIAPSGTTVIKSGDKIILSAATPGNVDGIELSEIIVKAGDDYENKKLSEIPREDQGLIIMVRRGEEVIIPSGDIVIKTGDMLVVNDTEG